MQRTPDMIRTFLFIGAIVASSSPALAGEIRVSLSGTSDAAMRADAHRAANRECTSILRGSLTELSTRVYCVRDLEKQIRSQLPAAIATARGTQVATR